MALRLPVALLVASCLGLGPALAQATKDKTPDPDEKICETIKPVGSRLATRRVCATRAQWAEQRKQDREETEKAQRLGCLTQGMCGGN